ncbi:hypothetical protein Mal4_27790 [Maioricimonas rarisocia]|uniref:Uncharacterized protein n=1 Tax=Maioricimonas rarisocia TaxID=2528026 RepID=A0A517Z7J6_9PLAN|nr:hypothetical protein Mal4_27790 [Maioricimonas rarisocia]
MVGVAHTKRECWVIAGFEPRTNNESSRLRDLKSGRSGLGFDPVVHSERLTATDESAKKSAKRVLNELMRGDPLREQSCWKETPLDLLCRRGERNGLTRFLSEIRDRLCPLFSRTD